MTEHVVKETFVRRVLWANAGFSSLSAIVLLVDAGPIAGWIFAGHPSIFGLTMTALLQTTAVGLFAFAAFVAWVAGRHDFDSRHARMVSAADLSWVAASVIGLILGFGWLTPAGSIIIAAVALIVLAFAITQLRGLA